MTFKLWGLPVYLEYPSSELLVRAQVAVLLDLIDCAGAFLSGTAGAGEAWLFRTDPLFVLSWSVELGSFIHEYSFFGNSRLLSFSRSSWERNHEIVCIQFNYIHNNTSIVLFSVNITTDFILQHKQQNYTASKI